MRWIPWHDGRDIPSFWRESVAPTIEPVSVAEMRMHCRIDHTDEDEYLAALIVAARMWCEDYCRRSFITRTIELKRPKFDESMDLPRGPVQSVTSVQYQDQDGATQTLSTDTWQYVGDPVMARVVVRSGKAWPVTNVEEHPVAITYVTGYGDASADVPMTIRQAIKMMVAQLYEYREPIVTGTSIAHVPMAVESLLSPYRVLGGYS